MEYTVMSEMSWSWRDLLDAPTDLVQEIAWRVHSDRKWRAKKQQIDSVKNG